MSRVCFLWKISVRKACSYFWIFEAWFSFENNLYLKCCVVSGYSLFCFPWVIFQLFKLLSSSHLVRLKCHQLHFGSFLPSSKGFDVHTKYILYSWPYSALGCFTYHHLKCLFHLVGLQHFVLIIENSEVQSCLSSRRSGRDEWSFELLLPWLCLTLPTRLIAITDTLKSGFQADISKSWGDF